MKNLIPYFFYSKLTSIIFSTIFLLLLNACGGKKVAPTLIPSDVSVVAVIDFKSLSGKAIEWKDIFSVDAMKSLMNSDAEADDLSKLLNSGLDFQQSAYIFTKISLKDKSNYVGFTFAIKDASKFEKTLKDNIKKGLEIKKEGKITYAYIKNDVLISWEGKQGLVVGSDNKSKDFLKTLTEKIRKTSSNESLEAKNSEFKTLLQGNFDMAVWADYQQIGDLGAEAYSDLPEEYGFMKDLTKMTDKVTATVNFEKGEIKAKSKATFNPEIYAKYKDLFKSSVDGSLISNTPIKTPAMFMTFGIGMKGLQRILDKAGLLKETKMYSSLMGITLDELFDMLSGDMVVAYKDANLESQMPQVAFAVGLGLKNKDLFDKMLNTLAGLPNFKKKDKYYVLQYSGYDLYLIEKDKMLFLTMTEDIRNNFLDSKEKLDGKFASLAKSSASTVYMDIAKTINPFLSIAGNSNSEEAKFTREIVNEFENIEVSTRIESNYSTSEGALKMSNKSRNSFAVLMEIARKSAEFQKKNEERNRRELNDSFEDPETLDDEETVIPKEQ